MFYFGIINFVGVMFIGSVLCFINVFVCDSVGFCGSSCSVIYGVRFGVRVNFNVLCVFLLFFILNCVFVLVIYYSDLDVWVFGLLLVMVMKFVWLGLK